MKIFWYEQPGDSVSNLMIKGLPPFDNIDLVLVTHKHSDHFGQTMVMDFLENNPNAALVCPRQADDLLRLETDYSRVAARINTPNSADTLDTLLGINKISIEALRFDHGQYFVMDFVSGKDYNIHKDIKNIGYLVNLGGFTIFNSGDCSFSDKSHFDACDFASEEIDVAFVNRTFFNREGQDLMNEYLRTKNLVFMHTPRKADYFRTLFKNIPDTLSTDRQLD